MLTRQVMYSRTRDFKGYPKRHYNRKRGIQEKGNGAIYICSFLLLISLAKTREKWMSATVSGSPAKKKSLHSLILKMVGSKQFRQFPCVKYVPKADQTDTAKCNQWLKHVCLLARIHKTKILGPRSLLSSSG